MGENQGRGLRSDSPLVFALQLLIYLSTLIRMVLRTPEEGLIGTAAYALMAAFLVLSILQVPIGRLWQPWTHLYLVLQCGIVTALFWTEPTVDWYGILCIGLCMAATRDLDPPWDLVWLALLCVTVTAGLVFAFGPAPAVPYIPVYVAACLLLGLYGRASRKAEAARARSEMLRGELETANRRLRAYAEEAEETAAARERARLARDLHDAATQTVFSMTLTLEAARMALDEDPKRLPALIARLQDLGRDALAELRSLVQELRAISAAGTGLVSALEQHAALRRRRDGLQVRLSVQGTERGCAAVKEALYRSAVEGLSNAVKHARVPEARVDLFFTAAEAVLRVVDAGKGFDPAAPTGSGSFGLVSMRERVEGLQGSLTVRSAAGSGTELEVRLPLADGDGPSGAGPQ